MQGVNERSALGNRILHLSSQHGISDFYITPWEQLMFRKNGELNLDSFVYQPENELEIQPGCLDYAMMIGPLRFRVNKMVTRGRLRWVLRLLPTETPTPEQILLPPAAMKSFLEAENGLFLVCGATGSGKSTTLNAMLRELNRPEDNILTLENPVEDEIAGVIHCDLKNSSEFKPMITSFMRSDPDIILMGEVRDIDSAELAIEAAITGHKVLTTIHCPRASQIIERFEQVGIERWKIAQTLKAACAQRLIKILCPSCKVQKDGVEERERLMYNLSDDWADRPFFARSVDGCGNCNHRGYSGRSAILEIIPITPKWSDALAKGEMSPYELELEVRKAGVLPNLRDSGLRMVREGKTDFEAIRKMIDLTNTD